jgi:hypothetical protein
MDDVLVTPYGLAAFITLLLLPDAALTATRLLKAVRRENLKESRFRTLYLWLDQGQERATRQRQRLAPRRKL